MRSYTCIVNRKKDGTWIGYFPALHQIPPIPARSKNQAKKKSFRALISFLQKCAKQGNPLPKDTSTTYFHRIDVNRLQRYPSLEEEPIEYELR